MAFDGFFVRKLVEEFNESILYSRINKINNLSNDEFIFSIRKGKNLKLYVSANSSASRIQLTNNSYENPQTPSNFCSVLRKYLMGGIIEEINQINNDRIIKFKIKNFDEEEKKILLDLLNMQIALISPKIIVFLGKEVAQMIENREVDLEKERGKFKKWKGDIDCYLTYDVETVIKARNESGKKAAVATNFWLDIKNIKERLDHNE